MNLNDVILCTEIESANQIRLAQGNIIGRAINHSSSLNQLSIFESLISDNPYIKFSKLISYDSLTTCETLRELILKDHQEVFGGEMEAWAFITRRTQVPWIILKAVSDFADDNTVRSTQSEATNCALNALNLIINHLKNSDQFSDIDFTNQSLKLKNFNLGNEIKIDFTNIQINDTKEDISKYLNEKIHPLIQFRLENFTFIHKDQNCNDLFATFLLEFIQNSIFHGQSKSVSIFFNKNIIKLKDNIDFYNIKTSENDGGGKLAWSLLEEKYLNTEKINYEYKDRKYCFTFNIMQDDLNIPNECYLKPHILNNVDECDHVFIDLKSSKMYSISKMFVPHVEQLLLNQKTVYIKIDSEGHELLFSRFKDEHPSKFFILY
ncbi:hypothetical protein LZZ98_00635 [Acinetobacter sp. SM34]|uniref:hypothetical protein n=1 Tax=Acinetobacter sp. SM34 TaxID=1301620 RepID=UPI001EDA2177|nr:hypothetical protein [Acinetobacter sp. SM34]MCG2607071.1 hypothetical protein [Acinetobacter sp. SM34]